MLYKLFCNHQNNTEGYKEFFNLECEYTKLY